MDPEELKKTEASTVITEGVPPAVTNNPVPPVSNAVKTEKVNVDEMAEENKGMLEVDWGNEKNDDLLKGKTRPISEIKTNLSITPAPAAPVDKEKFQFGIGVVVAVIDFILSNILAKIAGDGEKATSYTADKTGRQTFEEALCLLLETKRDLMPTWLIVLLAFASAWGFQIMAAIQVKTQKSKPVTEKISNDKDSLKPGLFIGTDGKVYRRYQNGSSRLAQFNPDGSEKIIGQPARRKAT